MLQWRIIQKQEFLLVRGMLRETFAGEDTYAPTADMTDAEIAAYWFDGAGKEVWLLEENGEALGTFYLQRNRPGLGGHVANCGYVVSSLARGRGLGRILGEKSLDRARERGFFAMQFNFVVSTNTRAVSLWESLGFRIVATIPSAFHYKRTRYDDAYVMFREL